MSERFGLIHYDAARHELAQAHRIDEAKTIHDKAKAMAVYAAQAKDRALIEYATEIRLRAERRAGELLREMAERNERQKPGEAGGKAQKVDGRARRPSNPKLSDLGVTKSQSSRWQKMAAMPEGEHEQAIADAKVKAVDTIDRAGKPKRPKSEKKSKPSAIAPIDRCTMTVRRIVREFMHDLPRSEWPSLLAALREQIDDLERIARKPNGHHAESKSA